MDLSEAELGPGTVIEVGDEYYHVRFDGFPHYIDREGEYYPEYYPGDYHYRAGYQLQRLYKPTGPIVKFKKLHPNAVIPQYQTDGAAGMDIHWDGKQGMSALSQGAGPVLYSTGLAVEIPLGFEGQLRPRSSLNRKGVVSYFGTIDSDYRGEFLVCLQALGAPVFINPGDRIAQLVIAPVSRATIQEVEELSETKRGFGGFGSTGR